MRKFLIIVMASMLFFGASEAGKKKDLAGKIENGVYTDDAYNFSLAIPEAWDSNIKKEKSSVRLALVKKQYDVPKQFQHAPSYTTVPRVTVYVDTTSLTTDQFVDSLLSNKFKSKQKNDILSEFKVLYGDFQLKKRTKIPIGDLSGVKISGQTPYTIELQRAGTESDKADVVTDFWGGSFFFVKDGSSIIMMQLICEWRYFDVIEQEFTGILDGFKIVKQP